MNPQVQLEFASWAIEQEDFPTASSAIIKAEKASSETPASRNLKGKIAFANQSYGVAEAHYQALAEKQPNSFDVVNMYALSLIESDDPEKQKMARDIAIRNFRALPENVVAQAALGFIELKLGETDQAKAILTRAARTAGSAPEIDFFLASLLAKLGETQQASLVVEGALKHKGLFLYRKSAEQLKKQLSEAAGDLPTPK
jgi:tetratricopeptide (TPR) repeat protein